MLLIDCHWYLSELLTENQLSVRKTVWCVFSLAFPGLYCAAPACSQNACYSCHILLWGWERCSGKLTSLRLCSDIKHEDPLVIAKAVSLIWLVLRWHGVLWMSFVISGKYSWNDPLQRRRNWSPWTCSAPFMLKGRAGKSQGSSSRLSSILALKEKDVGKVSTGKSCLLKWVRHLQWEYGFLLKISVSESQLLKKPTTEDFQSLLLNNWALFSKNFREKKLSMVAKKLGLKKKARSSVYVKWKSSMYKCVYNPTPFFKVSLIKNVTQVSAKKTPVWPAVKEWLIFMFCYLGN